MMLHPGIVSLSAMALVACAPAMTPHATSDCASGYHSLIGSHVGAVTLPRDLPHRIIGPNTAVTKDYNPARVNLRVDADGIIHSVDCG